jgi:glycosyltransferase involved in cell wall biosynthesis
VQLGLLPASAMAQTKAQELAVYRASDAIIVVTPDERAALIEEGISTPIFIVPTFAPVQDRSKTERGREVLFVGGFGHAPNIDAVLWFADKCWPLVRAKVPEAVFTIVGSKAPPQILALNERPGVQVIGYVEETAPFLDRAAVSIAPLRVGGGMKGKVCEALGAGTPLVTTPIGAQGIPLRHRESACVAESPAAFADEVIWALTHVDAAESMGSRGRDVIADLCGPDTVARYLEPLSEYIAALPKRYPLRRLWWHLFWSGGVLPAVRLWNRIGSKNGAGEVCGDC